MAEHDYGEMSVLALQIVVVFSANLFAEIQNNLQSLDYQDSRF